MAIGGGQMLVDAYESMGTSITNPDGSITTTYGNGTSVTENVDGTKINVTTVNGVVTLAGVLDTQVQVDNAIAIAKSIEGVKSVDTQALKTR